MVPHPFDLFLAGGDGAARPEALLPELLSTPHLLAIRGDPTRFIYDDPETHVRFSLVIERSLVPAARRGGEDGDDVEDDAPAGIHDVLPDEADVRELEQEEEEDGDLEAGDEDDDAPEIEIPPLALSVPLFRPSFFVLEALDLLDRLAEATGLLLVNAQEDGSSEAPQAWSPEEIVASYRRSSAQALAALKDPSRIRRWSAEQSKCFYEYALLRARIAPELEGAGVAAPRIYPALHGDAVKTLCVWRSGAPSLLPRSDLVLIQEPRERRGFFGRRTLVAEKLAPGGAVWNILAPFAEIRSEPAPHLIFRGGDKPPLQVTSALEALGGEPAEAARRTDLAGVVDFDLAAVEAEEL
jgi:hypothetical protein